MSSSNPMKLLAAIWAIAKSTLYFISKPFYDGEVVEQPRGTAVILNLWRDAKKGTVLMLVATHQGETRLNAMQTKALYDAYCKDPNTAHLTQFGGVGTGRNVSYYESHDSGNSFKFYANVGDFFAINIKGFERIARICKAGSATLQYLDPTSQTWQAIKMDGALQHALDNLLQTGERVFGSREFQFTTIGEGDTYVNMLTSLDSNRGINVGFSVSKGIVEAVFNGTFQTERTVVIGMGYGSDPNTVVTMKEEKRADGTPFIKLAEIPCAVIMAQLNTAMKQMSAPIGGESRRNVPAAA